jgi:hypothetical protein
MKGLIYILLLFLSSGYILPAQNTLAKIKFEDAEKAYYDGDYQNCLQLLNETEKILGQSAPNILFLKILTGHKLLEADKNYPYSQLATLRDQTNFYLTNYDIAGLEDKYRQVYEVSNALKVYPVNEEDFNQKREALLKEKELVKLVITDYVNAIGGLERINTIKTIYKVSRPYAVNGKEYKVYKIMLPDKISQSGAELKSLEKPYGSYVVNGDYGIHVIKPNNSVKKGPGPIKGLYASEFLSMKMMLRLSTIPEKDFLKDNIILSYEGLEEGLHKINVTYPDRTVETRFYNTSTKLLEKVRIVGNCLVDYSRLIQITSMTLLYNNYRDVDGILLPFDIIYKATGKYNTNQIKDERIWASSFTEIMINKNVTDYDFYLANSNNTKSMSQLKQAKESSEAKLETSIMKGIKDN